MKLSVVQQRMHWALWQRVKAVLMPGRSTWTTQEENERRHALYREATGQDISLTEMNNAQFDQVKAAMLAIVQPQNLNAQLQALNGQRKRLLFGIRKLALSMGADERYLQGIVSQMFPFPADKESKKMDYWQRERIRGGQPPPRKLEELHHRELTKVMVALRKHAQRGCQNMALSDGGKPTDPTGRNPET